MSNNINGGVPDVAAEEGVEWVTNISVQDISQLRHKLNQDVVRGLFCLHGSWHSKKDLQHAEGLLRKWNPSVRLGRKFVMGMVQVDESDDSMEAFCGDNGCPIGMGCQPPSELPALLAVVQDSSKAQSYVQIVQNVTPRDILLGGLSATSPSALEILICVKATFNSLILGVAASRGMKRRTMAPPSPPEVVPPPALRIFVAGDRANVGKTSVCLGLLGSLVTTMGYEPSDLAYIKPATQDESKQLLQIYCEKAGIQCVPLGPVVFYKGFTRAFLAGESESSEKMLEKITVAVNQLAIGKRVVVIDGVGYPAVGSICGTDNASVAKACGYSEGSPLGALIVGPSGVGNAVDSFNLNASYLESRNVPVMGAIFNKLATDGYYSIDDCREQVSSYFQQYQSTSKAFGFIPMFPELGGDNPMDHVDAFFQKFAENVDMKAIVESAKRIQSTEASVATNDIAAKKPRVQAGALQKSRAAQTKAAMLSRRQIEEQAAAAGAQSSC
jgi:dethiobiotin synthetase